MQALDDASCRIPSNVSSSSSSSSSSCCAEPLCLSNTNHNCCLHNHLHNQSQMHRHANRSPLTSPRLNHCNRLASTPAPAPAVDAAPCPKSPRCRAASTCPRLVVAAPAQSSSSSSPPPPPSPPCAHCRSLDGAKALSSSFVVVRVALGLVHVLPAD